jgi:hypothetical protein
MRVRECVVSVATAHKEMRQSAGRVDFDFEMMPFSVRIKIWRPVSNSVLMTKFQSNTFENIIHLSGVLRKKALPPDTAAISSRIDWPSQASVPSLSSSIPTA